MPPMLGAPIARHAEFQFSGSVNWSSRFSSIRFGLFFLHAFPNLIKTKANGIFSISHNYGDGWISASA
jgi:hypothetical protein